jgi:hypothetical protein
MQQFTRLFSFLVYTTIICVVVALTADEARVLTETGRINDAERGTRVFNDVIAPIIQVAAEQYGQSSMKLSGQVLADIAKNNPYLQQKTLIQAIEAQRFTVEQLEDCVLPSFEGAQLPVYEQQLQQCISLLTKRGCEVDQNSDPLRCLLIRWE